MCLPPLAAPAGLPLPGHGSESCLLLAACGAGSVTGADPTSGTGVDELVPELVDAPTETNSFHYSPVLCHLATLLKRNHGVVLGTVLEMEGPLLGAPFDALRPRVLGGDGCE